MNKLPDEIILCTLQVIVMPNGEILCRGKTIGNFKEFKKYLKKAVKK